MMIVSSIEKNVIYQITNAKEGVGGYGMSIATFLVLTMVIT